MCDEFSTNSSKTSISLHQCSTFTGIGLFVNQTARTSEISKVVSNTTLQDQKPVRVLTDMAGRARSRARQVAWTPRLSRVGTAATYGRCCGVVVCWIESALTALQAICVSEILGMK